MPLQSSRGKEPQAANLLGVHNTSNLGETLGGGGGSSHSGIQASGGAKYEPGDGYIYHYFVGGSNLMQTPTTAPDNPTGGAVHQFIVNNGPGGSDFGIFMCGGGGGGGQWPFGGNSNGSGGGGGGGVVTNGALTGIPIVTGTYTITIGKGAGSQGTGGNTTMVGPPDYPGTITANGGGSGGLDRPVTGHYDGGRYFPSNLWNGTPGGSGGCGGGGGGDQPQPTGPASGGTGGGSTQSDQTAPNWSPGTTFTGYGEPGYGGGKDGPGGGGGGGAGEPHPGFRNKEGEGGNGVAIAPSPGIPGFHPSGGAGGGGGRGGPDPSNEGGDYGGGRGGSPTGRRASNGVINNGGGGGGSGGASPFLGNNPPMTPVASPTNKLYPYGNASGGYGSGGMVLISYPAALAGPLAPWGFPAT